MKNLKLIILACCMLASIFANAQTWGTANTLETLYTGTGGDIGKNAKLLVVNGNPAMVSFIETRNLLIYVRATDASGTTWGTPVAIATPAGATRAQFSFAIVNGNPAVAYNENAVLKYVRATNVSGTTWGSPVTISSGHTFVMSMAVVNGNPAIAYTNAPSNYDLYYVAASDASGTTWGSPATIDNTAGTTTCDLVVVNGNPAVLFDDAANDYLRYIRASNASGSSWGSSVAVTGTSVTIGSMQVINGNPAIAYRSSGLQYMRATDASGTTWGSPVSLNTSGYGAPDLQVVNGNPAISYSTFVVSSTYLNYIRASDADGTTWGSDVQIESCPVSSFTCMAIVNSNPAIAYYDGTNKNMKYVRASDASGTTWNSSLTFDVAGRQSTFNSITMVNGNPAKSFFDIEMQRYRYTRATNASGTAWSSPIAVGGAVTGGNTYSNSLDVVNGYPALSYYRINPGADLVYVRANDANGTSWGTEQVLVTSGSAGQYNSLEVVNGNPAIAYYDGTDLWYMRATDADGTTWGSPVTLDALGSVGLLCVLAVVNGNPAVAYYDQTNFNLKYVRATDASGSTWGTPITIASTGNTGAYPSLAIVNGNPAIAFQDLTNGDLKYIRATDADGTAWGSEVTVDATGSVGVMPSLVIVKGNPAISYTDATNGDVKYVRAADISGTEWGAPVVLDADNASYSAMVSNGTSVFVAYGDQTNFYAKNITGNIYAWTAGAGTTDWATAANWDDAIVPSNTTSVHIPAGLSFYPSITSGTPSCNNLTMNSGGTIAISTGNSLSVKGNFVNSGTTTGAGKITLNGSTAQTIQGSGSTLNLELDNTSGATVCSTLNITNTYIPTTGTLAAGGYLTLKSTVSSTARITAGSTSGGYITGNTIIERYIPAKRAFRFFSHPFNASIALSQLTDDIDITGTGGNTNGFTTTQQNNPSSYWYDVTAGDNTTTGNNPGWTAFTHTNGSGANAWSQYGAARILVRGAIGQGLTSAAYTPSVTTLDLSGVVNQGNTTVNLTKGSGTNFVLVGNPFPSQVNMDALTNTNVGSAFYIWDATQGAKGGYTSYTFGSSSFNLPSCAAFATTLSANGSIVFEEADKTSGTSGAMFKPTATANTVQLRLEDSTTFWDRLLLRFDDNAMAAVDYPDAAKLYNPDMSFYTWSKDDSMLSIDARPYAEETIELGLYSTLKKNFKIVAADFDIPAGTKLFLHDKYLNKTEEITATGYEYWFAVDTNTASWGDSRFELNTQGKPTSGILSPNTINTLKVKLVPNPAVDNVAVYYEGLKAGNMNISITNMMGVKVANMQQASNKAGSVRIPLQNIPSGIYIVTLQNAGQLFTQKLIKQ